MVDLAKYDTTEASDRGARMQMYLPNGDIAEGSFVVLLGPDSEVARKQERARQQALIDRASATRGKAPKLSADEMAERSLAELVDLTVRFEGIEIDGEDVGADKDAIRSAYERHRWLADDARMFIQDRANFFPSASGS